MKEFLVSAFVERADYSSDLIIIFFSFFTPSGLTE